VAHRNPTPTVDVIIEISDIALGGQSERSQPSIVLIERRNPPLGWALPGGFVDYGESVETAARREAKEETGLDVNLVEQFHVYSDPSRDPRQHTLSVVFLATAEGTPQAGDDAQHLEVFELGELPTNLCFDHDRILRDYQNYRATGRRPALG
jgi:8-oxo-dGTP diphosphatase